MSYQLSADNRIITRIADGARFPVPSDDYPPSPDQQTYLDWIALGNAPLPSDDLDGVKEDARQAINNLRDQKLAAGFAYDFGLPHGVQVLQLRNETDKTNWLTQKITTKDFIEMGLAEQMLPLRPESNAKMILTSANLSSVLFSMSLWGGQTLSRSWDLKDAVDVCETVADVLAIDITVGWPS